MFGMQMKFFGAALSFYLEILANWQATPAFARPLGSTDVKVVLTLINETIYFQFS